MGIFLLIALIPQEKLRTGQFKIYLTLFYT